MSLQKRWRSLDRSTVASAPDRYGVYELGDESGESLGLWAGVVRDDLKEVLAYGDVPGDATEGTPAKVRWTGAHSRDHAQRLLEEHR